MSKLLEGIELHSEVRVGDHSVVMPRPSLRYGVPASRIGEIAYEADECVVSRLPFVAGHMSLVSDSHGFPVQHLGLRILAMSHILEL